MSDNKDIVKVIIEIPKKVFEARKIGEILLVQSIKCNLQIANKEILEEYVQPIVFFSNKLLQSRKKVSTFAVPK